MLLPSMQQHISYGLLSDSRTLNSETQKFRTISFLEASSYRDSQVMVNLQAFGREVQCREFPVGNMEVGLNTDSG